MINPKLVKPKSVIYIHKETTNQSFLDMHYYLRTKGIANNSFFLALYDPDLRGVDPRDPNLPTYMKAKIMIECKRNYWYFLREVVRIPDQGGDPKKGKRFKLDRASLAINYLFILCFNIFAEEPRQHGKTTTAVCRYLWIYNFGTTNSEIMFMHKDHSGSKDNLKKLKAIRDALPSYLRMSSADGVNGKKLKVPNTVQMIEHPYNKNKIKTFASARSRAAANNLGRGATMPFQYYDEFAFMLYNKEVYLAAVPAFSTASKNAKQNGAPYGILITTTPGDLLTEQGSYAYEIRNNATVWNELYYDYTYEQMVNLRDCNKRSNFFLVSYTYQQLGSGPDYFNRMVIEMNRSWPDIRREVMLEWAEISNNCPFTHEDLETIKANTREPIRMIPFGKFNQYQFLIYSDLDTSYPPIIGVDVSGSLYQDSSAITVIDSKTTNVTATLNCNFMPADDLADVIYTLVTKYLPNAIVNIERNGGFGISVIQRLVKTSIKKNLYWEIKDKVVEESFNGIRSEKVTKKVRVYGLDSSKSIRARLIELLYQRVNYHKDKFIAPILQQEMSGMETKKSGKVEHSDHTHDDQVFSYLMALYVWYDGKDLAENFGIQKNTIKTDEDIEIDEHGYEDQLEQHERLNFGILNPITTDDFELVDQIEALENDKFITSDDIQEQQYFNNINNRKNILDNNIAARNSYMKENQLYGTVKNNTGSGVGYNYTQLPDSIYTSDPYDEEDDEFNLYKGNLAHFWNKI